MQVLVGDFTEEDLKNGKDKVAVEKAKKENNLNYVNTKLIKRNKKTVAIRIWVCDIDTFKI